MARRDPRGNSRRPQGWQDISGGKSAQRKAAIKAAMQVIVPAAVGSGAVILAGCSDLRPSAKTQTMSLYAIGIPGIAVVTQSTQEADNRGDDENKPSQTNPTTVNTKMK